MAGVNSKIHIPANPRKNAMIVCLGPDLINEYADYGSWMYSENNPDTCAPYYLHKNCDILFKFPQYSYCWTWPRRLASVREALRRTSSAHICQCAPWELVPCYFNIYSLAEYQLGYGHGLSNANPVASDGNSRASSPGLSSNWFPVPSPPSFATDEELDPMHLAPANSLTDEGQDFMLWLNAALSSEDDQSVILQHQQPNPTQDSAPTRPAVEGEQTDSNIYN
ncbi:uncharacterized protein LOC115074427 [Rhinatrema bivittatum]|uniref:uncharacterized protein LOC115074427 n=1 Tax=Rhinatrema bivittatum TaxID=194408 RepID=UPI001126E119|nr:uncharacterized protein LOC115074427 [Rhinatrema bivittatum]